MHNIILKPLFTEKVSTLTADQNKYAFVVDIKANKIEIKQAIQKKFNVTVESVTTAIFLGKTKMIMRKAGRFAGKKPDFKKAYVILKKGEKIDLFEQV
jgi:large subunit ribosomal protein L23